MRITLVIALLVAGFAVADATQLGHLEGAVAVGGTIAGDDIFCSQPFDFGALENGVGMSEGNGWMITDDFNPADGGTIDMVEIWAIYAAGNTTGFNIELREDASAAPGAIIDTYGSTAVDHTNTGMSQWGYSLWYTIIDTEDIMVDGGMIYWLVLQTVTGTGPDYWLAGPNANGGMTYFSDNGGSSWQSSQNAWGAPYDQFMIISGTVSLSRDTWGTIKTLF